jgi:hypothetical protein
MISPRLVFDQGVPEGFSELAEVSMLTTFNVFAVVVVLLLWWIGTNVYAIAKRREPPHDPEDRPLTWRENMILNKRPDHSGSDEDWLKWHEKYKDKINTKYFMPERFDRP